MYNYHYFFHLIEFSIFQTQNISIIHVYNENVGELETQLSVQYKYS